MKTRAPSTPQVTFVNINLTVAATKAVNTKAGIVSNSIQARPPIQALIYRTVIRIDKAIPPFVPNGTFAPVGSVGVDTNSAISTR